MNVPKMIILTITALITLSILMLMVQFLLRKVKSTAEDGTMNLSFGIWFASLFLPGAFLTTKTVSVFAEAIDNLYKVNVTNGLSESFKTGSLLIGLNMLWLVLWYSITNVLSAMITGKRIASKEVEAGNYSYFLIRGTILIGFIICLLPVFDIILRTFIPHVEVPFYH